MATSKDTLKNPLKGRFRITQFRAGTDEVLWQSDWYPNLITEATNHGYNILLQNLASIDTYPVPVTKAKIGTGTTAPAVTDTDLETVVTDDIPRGNTQLVANRITFTFFVPDALLPNGTYTEWGIFCGEQLFSRALISPSYTKADNSDSRFEHVIDIA